MENKISDIKLQFNGYCNTPSLWNNSLNTLIQHILITNNQYNTNLNVISEVRLGKRVERFVSICLKQQSNIEIVAENIQIIKDKTTLGELDCIIIEDETPIHLEIVYKFYLYNPCIGNTELDHWIGPNKRDSLVNKLNKLKEKQLPLLHKPETQNRLNQFNIKVEEINQRVHFKAQLFILLNTEASFDQLNEECLYGYYIHYKGFVEYQTYQFYFPSKLDWLIDTHNRVDWMDYDEISEDLNQSISNEISPLCWMKDSNNNIIKLFIVWW